MSSSVDYSDFPFRSIADKAGPVSNLCETLVLPKRVVLFRNVKNPDGIIDGTSPTVMGTGGAHIIVDFGEEVVGYLDVTARVQSKTGMTVNYGESIEEALDWSEDSEQGWYRSPKDILEFGEHISSQRHKGRRAFRYVCVRSHSEIELHKIRMTCVHYPVKNRGSFSCSDVLLNRIWDMCRLTTKLCMQRFYEDGIKRDGLLWVSDYRVQFLSNWAPFGDADLARRSLLLIAASQRIDGAIPACAAVGGGHQHPDNIDYMPGIPHGSIDHWILIHYASDYLSCLLDYVLYTGDVDLINEIWPTVERLIEFLQGYDYNFDSSRSDIVTECDDWKSPGTALMQVLVGVQDGKRLAEIIGDERAADTCNELAIRLRSQVMTNHFDRDNGYFTDEIAAMTEGHTSWHINYFAVLAGMVSKSDAASLLQKMTQLGIRQAAWGGMRTWQHAGLFESGLPLLALNGIREYYGTMLDYGATTAWEGNDIPRNYNCLRSIASRCHGWSAGASYLLPRYVLGVQPLEPGFESVRICPQLSDLKWAEGIVPTLHGDIRVQLESGGECHFTLPHGIRGELIAGSNKLPLAEGVTTFKYSEVDESSRHS